MNKEYKQTALSNIPMVAATLAAAILGQKNGIPSKETAVALYFDIAGLLSDRIEGEG